MSGGRTMHIEYMLPLNTVLPSNIGTYSMQVFGTALMSMFYMNNLHNLYYLTL